MAPIADLQAMTCNIGVFSSAQGSLTDPVDAWHLGNDGAASQK